MAAVVTTIRYGLGIIASLCCALHPYGLARANEDDLGRHVQWARDRGLVLEEIIVTARKREERLRDVPAPAIAFSELDLKEQSVRDLYDLQFQAPNLQIAPFPAVGADASVSMRGQSQFEPVITLDPAVGIYVDGVYLGRSTGALLNLVDLERVEVLRGPQGTLYGRNTTGGVIHLISKHNADGVFGGYLGLTGGDLGRRDVTAGLSLPLVEDRLAARLSFRAAHRDGFARNTLLDEDLENESALFFRANLNWRPTDSVEVVLSYDRTRQRERSSLFNLETIDPTVLDPTCLDHETPSLGCLINFAITGGQWADALGGNPRRVRSGVSSRHDLDVEGVAATVSAAFDRMTLKSITAYRRLDRRNVNDIDGTEWAILHPDAEADQQQLSQEFQLSGDALDARLDWLAGVFLFDEQGNDDTTIIGVPALNPTSPSTIQPHGENDSRAVYGHLTYAATERVNVHAGLRYTRERRRLSESQFDAGGCTLAFVNRPPCRTEVAKTFDGWSYTAGLDYRWRPNLLAYLTASRGFKSGGFVARARNEIEFEPFEPEIVDNFEAGIKSQWLDNRVNLDLALFYSDYRDIQRTRVIALSPTEIATTVTNAASAKVSGGELQLSALPATGLLLSATVGLIAADYRRFDDFDAAGNPIDRSDLDFPRTPKWNYSLLARYTVPLGGREFVIQGDYSWRSKTFHDVLNSPSIAQPAFGLLNLRASLFSARRDLELALYVKNLTGEDYVTGGLDLLDPFGYTGTFLGPPRTVAAELTWHFGNP